MKQVYLICILFTSVTFCSGQVSHYLPQSANAQINPATLYNSKEISLTGTSEFIGLNNNEYQYSFALDGNFWLGNSGFRTAAFRGAGSNMSYSGLQLTSAHWVYLDDDVRVSFGLKGHFHRYSLEFPLMMPFAENGDIPVGSARVIYLPDLDAGLLLHYKNYSVGFVAAGMTGKKNTLSDFFYDGTTEQSGILLHGSYSGRLSSEIQIMPSLQIKYSNTANSRSKAGIWLLYRKMSGLGFSFDTNGNPGVYASLGLGRILFQYSAEKLQYFDAEDIGIQRFSVIVNLPG